MSTVAKTPQRLNRPHLSTLPHFLLMSDEQRLADPVEAVRGLPPGGAVIFRHYRAKDRADKAAVLSRAARKHAIPLIVGKDARLARRLKAAGLHLTEHSLKSGPQRWRLLRKPGLIVTAAVHDRVGLIRAWRAGCQAALVSPVFATKSHPATPPLGPWRFGLMVRNIPMALYPLGGLNARSIRRLPPNRLSGWAGISFFTSP